MGTNRCSDWIFLVNFSCELCQFYLAVSAGRKQQQITEQLLMNHFIFTAINDQLPHLLTQKYNFQILYKRQLLTENNRIHFILCACDYSDICDPAQSECVVKLTSCWSKTRSMSSALMCCFFPWSCRRKGRILKLLYKRLIETDNNQWPCCAFSTHPVFHGLLDKSEAFPAWVKLLLVSASEKHEVTDDLQSDRQTKGAVRPPCAHRRLE